MTEVVKTNEIKINVLEQLDSHMKKKKKKKSNLNSSYTIYIKINPNVKCKIIKLLGETQGEIFVTLC